MNVILTRDMKHLGAAGKQVSVKDGYARNFLIPRGFAQPATTGAVRQLETERQALESLRARQRSNYEQTKTRLEQHRLAIRMPAGPDGKLFGAVTTAHIAEQIMATAGIGVNRRAIELEAPIAAAGDYRVSIDLHPDVVATLTISVVAVTESPTHGTQQPHDRSEPD